eukprot:g2640.t1
MEMRQQAHRVQSRVLQFVLHVEKTIIFTRVLYRTGACDASTQGFTCTECNNKSCGTNEYRAGECNPSTQGFTCEVCNNIECGTNQYRTGVCDNASTGYTCSACPSLACNNMSYLYGICQGTTNTLECKACDNYTCNENYHREGVCEGTRNEYRCEANECVCENGTKVANENCTGHGNNMCRLCSENHYLSNHHCVLCVQPTCEAWQHVSGSCGGDTNSYQCVQNTCTCQNGNEASGTACLQQGDDHCVSCRDDFYLDGKTCTQCNNISCNDVEKYRSGTCTASNHGYSCESCGNLSCSTNHYRSGTCTDLNPTFTCSPCDNQVCGENEYQRGSCQGVTNGFQCEACSNQTCGEGQYREGTCEGRLNNYSCETCSNITCPSGTYRTGTCDSVTRGYTCTPCNPGYVGSSCERCSTGSYETDHFTCVRCPLGKYTLSIDNIKCESCAEGQYRSHQIVAGTHCLLCPEGKYDSKDDPMQCKLCPIGKWNSTKGEVACDFCGTTPISATENVYGQYLKRDAGNLLQDQTLPSRSHHLTETDIINCQPCNTRTLNYGVSFCSFCDATNLPQRTQCQCTLGKLWNDDIRSASDCPMCPAGRAVARTQQMFNRLSVRLTQKQNPTAIELMWGYYDNIAGVTIDGHNYTKHRNTVALACPFFCDDGFYSTLGNSCTACEAGRYSLGLGSNTCANCEAGKYKTKVGKGSCEWCQIGKTQALYTADGDSRNHGTYNARTPSVANGTVAENCTACEKGWYRDKVEGNASGCVLCPHGKYQQREGQSKCEIIPSRACVLANKFELEYCATSCPPGRFNLHNSGSCSDCPAGRYAEGTARRAYCIACAAGKHAADTGNEDANVCITCISGKWAKEASADCRHCPKGKFSKAEQEICYNCPAGRYSTIVGATGDGSGSSPASTECIGTRPGVIQTCSGSPSWATHDDERVLTPIISGAQNCITNTNYASSGNPLRDVDLKNVCATELGCFIEINGKTAHPFRAPTDDQSLSGGIPLLQSEGVETLSSDSNCANDHVDFYMSKSSCTSQKNTFGISCCSSENKCGAGEGKCINDNDCYSNLECGAGKCSWGGAGDKCCYLPDGETFVPNALKDWNCGITRQDCLKRCAQNAYCDCVTFVVKTGSNLGKCYYRKQCNLNAIRSSDVVASDSVVWETLVKSDALRSRYTCLLATRGCGSAPGCGRWFKSGVVKERPKFWREDWDVACKGTEELEDKGCRSLPAFSCPDGTNLSASKSILERGSPEYDKVIQLRPNFNPICNDHTFPRFLVQPRNVSDVARVVRKLFLLKGKVKLAIRSGGHSYICASLGENEFSEETLLMDMYKFKNTYMISNNLLKIGSGSTWIDVLKVTKAANVHTIHGNCGDIGAIGCLLKGCIELFKGLSMKIGLGVDNIVGFTAVLMDGHVVKVTDPGVAVELSVLPVTQEFHKLEENELSNLAEELWFAVRGAGSSFVVVTEVILKTYAGLEHSAWFGNLERIENSNRQEDLKTTIQRDESDALLATQVLRKLKSVGLEGYVRLDCSMDSHNLWPDIMVLPTTSTINDENGAALLASINNSMKSEGAFLSNFEPLHEPLVEDTEAYHEVWGAKSKWGGVAGALVSPTTDEIRAFAKATASICRDQICDGCWGVLSQIGVGHRKAAIASKSCVNPARSQAEFYFEVDCGSSTERWKRCSDGLRAIQKIFDAVTPSRSWHYANIGNSYNNNDEQRSHLFWGIENYERLQRIKTKLDQYKILSVPQGVIATKEMCET